MATPYRNPPTTTIKEHPSVIPKEKVASNEQILSQKLNQLSPFKSNQEYDQTSKITTTTTMKLSSKTSESTVSRISHATNFNSIPDYLCRTNPSFEKKFQCILPSTSNLEELRHIAILMHKITSIDMVYSLWLVYQKSYTGDLQQPTLSMKNSYDRKVCPKEVLSLMKRPQQNSHIHQDTNKIDCNQTCLTFINDYLRQLNQQNEESRQQLQKKSSQLLGYTRGLEHNLDKFVQQGLSSQRIELDRDMALVQYDYTDELFKRAYLALNPSDHQMQTFKRLCKLKYNQELSKHEVNFLKQQTPIYLASHPFEKQPIAELSLMDNISNPTLRQQLYEQYKQTAEQARMKMMQMYVECASEQTDQYQEQFNTEMKQMWERETTLSSEQRMTPIMHKLLDQRLANITARFECLYKFKIQLLKVPTNVK